MSPLWFVSARDALWLKSLIKTRRWADVERDPRTSIVVDSGHDIEELRGVELSGKMERVGEAPRLGDPNSELEEPERLYTLKYYGHEQASYDDRDG